MNKENWNILERKLRRKANSNKKIIKIERYICKEFKENNNLLLKGGNYNNNLLPLFILGVSLIAQIRFK